MRANLTLRRPIADTVFGEIIFEYLKISLISFFTRMQFGHCFCFLQIAGVEQHRLNVVGACDMDDMQTHACEVYENRSAEFERVVKA